MADPIIRAQHLTKIYGSGETAVRALDDVTFNVMPGELLAIEVVARYSDHQVTLQGYITP